jgi:hypothetical protein
VSNTAPKDVSKEVSVLPVPTNGWINGGWNKKSSQFYLLAEMLGLKKPSISPDDLQDLFRKVSSAKVFADNIQSFLEETGWDLNKVQDRLFEIEAELGLLRTLPFMSLRGMSDPSKFKGVAIWPAGTVNWMALRHDEIVKAYRAGAEFDRVLVMWSKRECTSAADQLHPYGRPEPHEVTLTEWGVMGDIWGNDGIDSLHYERAALPDYTPDGHNLSLQQQLEHLMSSDTYEELIGGADIYVPSTPNSLYVPLHVMRVLGKSNVWFSQIQGAVPIRKMPEYFTPGVQDIMTTPNGILRLWVELIRTGCLTN